MTRGAALTLLSAQHRSMKGRDASGTSAFLGWGGNMEIDNRKEQRIEIPDPCRKYLTFTVKQEQEPVRAVIGNFSRNGILFECPRQFAAGDRTECSLKVNRATPREITFEIEVKYCYENEGTFITGASIDAISHDKWFDAFEKLFDMIVTRQGAS